MAATTTKHSRPQAPKVTAVVPRSPAERLWLVGGGTAALLLTVVAYFFFISPQRAQTADVRGRTATARQQSAVLQHRLDVLRDQNRNLGAYQHQLAAARRALPAGSGVPDLLRTLQVLGAQTGTAVTSLSVGQPMPVTPAGTRRPPAAPVYSLAISAQVTGPAAGLNRFLDQLQGSQPRAVLVTALTETTAAPTAANPAGRPAGAATGTTTLQLSMLAFVAPAPSGRTPGSGTGR